MFLFFAKKMETSLKTVSCTNFKEYVAEHSTQIQEFNMRNVHARINVSNASKFFGGDDWVFFSTELQLTDIKRRCVYTQNTFVPRMHTVADICRSTVAAVRNEMTTAGLDTDKDFMRHIVFTQSVISSIWSLLMNGDIALCNCTVCYGSVMVANGKATCMGGCSGILWHVHVRDMVYMICNENGIEDCVYFVIITKFIVICDNVFESCVEVNSGAVHVEWYYNKNLSRVIK